jgi:uncharacterized protein
VARPEKLRTVGWNGEFNSFKPVGVPASELQVETLRLDELEALRLADIEGLYQEAAAEQMGISRQTFARVLGRARSTVARAVVEGKLLVTGDGPVVTRSDGTIPCPVHGMGRRRGRGCRCGSGRGWHGHGADRS